MKKFPLKETILFIISIGLFIVINFPFAMSLGFMGLAINIIVTKDFPIDQAVWPLFYLSLSVAWWTLWEFLGCYLIFDNLKILIQKMKEFSITD